MALIDFRGFRLTAQSLLPIHPADTLVLGSSNAGEVVFAEDWAVDKFAPLGRALNLKKHLIAHQQLWGPFDLEGHLGRDQRFYLLDFARLFPPELPAANEKRNTHLFHLLRPELCRSHPIPLCSDAFSFASQHDAAQHEREVFEATQRLHRFVIPEYARWLLCQNEIPSEHYPSEFSFNTSLHSRGINMRHLLRVLVSVFVLSAGQIKRMQHFEESIAGRWARNILSEMIARTIKEEIRDAMRQAQFSSIQLHRGASEDTYRSLLVSFLNKYLVSTSTMGQDSWAQNNRRQQAHSSALQNWTHLSSLMQRKYEIEISFRQKTVKSTVLELLPFRSHWPMKTHHDEIIHFDRLKKYIIDCFDARLLIEIADRRAIFIRLTTSFRVVFQTEVHRFTWRFHDQCF